MFLHGGVEFLRKVIGDIGHPWLLLIGSAQAALVLTRLLVVLLLCIFAVTFRVLQGKENKNMGDFMLGESAYFHF